MSIKFFEEKPRIAKREPHKRKVEKVIKKDNLKIIFEKFIDAKVKQSLRPNTLNKYVVAYNSLDKYYATVSDQPLYLENITTDLIRNFVYWQKNDCVKFEGHKYTPAEFQTKGLADATIETRIKNLKTFMSWCQKEELIQKNPFDKYEGFQQTGTDIDILTRSEIDELLKVAKVYSKKSFKHFRDYVLLHLLVDGMLRITETLLIAPHDVNHSDRSILIQSKNAKSRKSRMIPLSNKTYRLIEQLLIENEAFEGDVDDLLFLSLSGKMLSKNNLLRDIRKYAVEAGITKRFYLHLIRHSSATHYLSSSGDLESLRKILGHADLRTVLIYAHMADNTVQEKHASAGFFGTENKTYRKRNNKRI